MTLHTTHHDDCGCLAAQHAAEIAKALAERDAARKEVVVSASTYEAAIHALRAEVERLRKAIQNLPTWVNHNLCDGHAVPGAVLDEVFVYEALRDWAVDTLKEGQADV